MTRVDYLVIGSGLTGATIARLLADAGREVLVLDRRSHPGGNVHDSTHPSGIRVHTYGPHYFRCTSQRIWDFVNRFTRFVPYVASVKCRINGRIEDWPINRSLFDADPDWLDQRPPGKPSNFEQACLQKMPRHLYETFVQRYTRRQWGMDPKLLDARLAGRIRVNDARETTLTPRHRFQGLPEAGYAALMENLLAGIPQFLGIDYLPLRSEFVGRRTLVFTGPIDEFFGFDEGRLAYRGQKRVHEFLPNIDCQQPCAQVNHSDVDDHGPIRTIEWKHLMPAQARLSGQGTILTQEFPFTPDDADHFEYPLPAPCYRQLYARYNQRAKNMAGLVICGRLGEYRYLDMDHAIARAMLIAAKLLQLSDRHHSGATGTPPPRRPACRRGR